MKDREKPQGRMFTENTLDAGNSKWLQKPDAIASGRSDQQMPFTMTRSNYKEKQRLTNWELPLLISSLMIALMVKMIIQHWISPSANALPFGTFALLVLPMTALLWYTLSLKLSIKVNKEGIKLQYFPFQSKKYKIKWDEIEACEFVQTPANAQWSGWNVQYHEKSYSLCGRTGMHIRTKSGEDLLIGTKNYTDFRKAVMYFLKKHQGL